MPGKEDLVPKYTPKEIQEIEFKRSITAAHAQLGDARYGNDGVLYFPEGGKRIARYEMEAEFRRRAQKEKRQEGQKLIVGKANEISPISIKRIKEGLEQHKDIQIFPRPAK
jgi:hypothetical protein